MSDYAIGDVQGCYEPLMRLLARINFNEQNDTLWFVGDLVNRGPQSLEVLRFIKNLANKAYITLGNHDLYLLSKIFTEWSHSNPDDTLDAILEAPDRYELGHWLRAQSLLVFHSNYKLVMTHAGIAPCWNLQEAIRYAEEIENILRGENFQHLLLHMYGNQANHWSDTLQGLTRWRTIINYLTRMRYCDRHGRLLLDKKHPFDSTRDLFPWYQTPLRKTVDADIIFGHWAALKGQCPVQSIHALDTGCLWGGTLTALRLCDKKIFSVPGQTW